MLNFLAALNCKSIDLNLQIVQIPSDWRLEEKDEYDLSNIQGLTELVIDDDNPVINDEDGVRPNKDVKVLTAPGSNVLIETEKYFPNTEKLYLYEIDGAVPKYLHLGPKVAEVTYTKRDGKDVESSREVFDFFTELKGMDQIKKINGVDKDKFDIPVSEEIKKEEGTPKLGSKIIVKIDSENSVEAALAGDDFYGIPNDRLAKTFEEADTYLNVHPYHELAGSYTNGGMAYKTHTMVITFDIKNGGKRAAKLIGSTNPPQTITTYNNIPTGGSGEFLKDKALEYVKTLL